MPTCGKRSGYDSGCKCAECRDWKRGKHLWDRYGVTLADFEAIKRSQDGKCAICLTVVDRLHLDHCHDTGTVRGLLCKACNVGIGELKDSPAIMSRAIRYLTEWERN